MFKDCILLKIFPLYNYFYLYKFGLIPYPGLTFAVLLVSPDGVLWDGVPVLTVSAAGQEPAASLLGSISTRRCGAGSWSCLNTISMRQTAALIFRPNLGNVTYPQGQLKGLLFFFFILGLLCVLFSFVVWFGVWFFFLLNTCWFHQVCKSRI